MVQYNEISENDVVNPVYAGPLYSNHYVRDIMRRDLADLEVYQNGGSSIFSEERLVEMQVLDTLSKLHFPMEADGTFLYKAMIIKAMKQLDGFDGFGEAISEDELLNQMQSRYSQFYLDTARYDLDLGIKTFHAFVEAAFNYVDYSNVDPTLLFEIYGDFSNEADYGQHAFIIAKYIRGMNEKKQEETAGHQYVKSSTVMNANI